MSAKLPDDTDAITLQGQFQQYMDRNKEVYEAKAREWWTEEGRKKAVDDHRAAGGFANLGVRMDGMELRSIQRLVCRVAGITGISLRDEEVCNEHVDAIADEYAHVMNRYLTPVRRLKEKFEPGELMRVMGLRNRFMADIQFGPKLLEEEIVLFLLILARHCQKEPEPEEPKAEEHEEPLQFDKELAESFTSELKDHVAYLLRNFAE